MAKDLVAVGNTGGTSDRQALTLAQAANGNEGSTSALGDAQARKLLEAPPADTLKGVHDRAILATLLKEASVEDY